LIQDFDKTAHVGALVAMGQVHVHIDRRHRVLIAIAAVQHLDRVAQVLYADFIDGNIPIIGFILDVSHASPVCSLVTAQGFSQDAASDRNHSWRNPTAACSYLIRAADSTSLLDRLFKLAANAHD
jgi:hypothetical protein